LKYFINFFFEIYRDDNHNWLNTEAYIISYIQEMCGSPIQHASLQGNEGTSKVVSLLWKA
jgi:hypothetical protein